jgi:hypothetical protein
MLTKPITYASWITETTVGGSFSGNKTRSTLLVAIDTALDAYEKAGAAAKVARLQVLFDAYETWFADKKKKTDGSVKSIRDSGDQMAVFEGWLQDEQARWLLPTEDGWGNGPNCYAFAMKCKRPAGNGMTPGSAAGAAASMRGIERNLLTYSQRLLDGIGRDGMADGAKAVTILPADLLEAPRLPRPAPMPTVIPQDHYLTALLVTAGGFHFMRRDTASGLWCHKNGSYGTPEYGAELSGTVGRLGRRKVPITDAVALDLLANQAGGRYASFGGGFIFAGYVMVPDAGITVSGSVGKFNA